MGLIDLIKPKKEKKEVATTRSALEAAKTSQADDGAIGKLVLLLLDFGLDGKGPVDSATKIAEESRKKTSTVEQAVNRVARRATLGGAIGGFATGLGGFATMPVAMPLNVFEFYVQATRMVGAIAHLRGYDIKKPEIRTAILLTLIGSHSDDVLAKAGITTGGGRLASLATKQLPQSALLVVNKAIGFRIARGVGEKVFSRLGRAVPVAGGVFGGGIDGFMMKKIADQALKEFPVLR